MKKFKNLELVIHDLKNQLFISDEQKEQKIKESLKWKLKVDILEQDKRFLEKQLKEARKHNRLLKIAISKLQNDFERLARETRHPIEIAYSLHEEDKNNLLEQLDKVITEHQELGLDLTNKEVLEKLDEANRQVQETAKAQVEVNKFTAYSDNDKLRRERMFRSEKKSISRSNLHYETKSLQKYDSPQKVVNLHNSFKHNSNKLPVGSAHSVSAIKRKLASDTRWNQY